MPAYTTFH